MAKHPAKFSDEILPIIDRLLGDAEMVLDPFAGVGRIHELNRETVGIEIEPEWALQHPRTFIGNALKLPFPDETFDAIATSPCYGNRMADHHDAKDGSRRITYRHLLGRPLHPDNSGKLQWGDAYRAFHLKAWAEAVRVLKRNGRFVLNISNHIRANKEQLVTEWHSGVLGGMGLSVEEIVTVKTPRLRFGQNHEARPTREFVILFKKGT